MKTEAYLSREYFLIFFAYLESLGFVRMTREQIAQRMRNKKLDGWMFRKQEGPEVGYVRYFDNGKSVIVWATYSEALGGAITSDEGWVAIVDEKNPEPFFLFPARRSSGNYFENLKSRVNAALDVVQVWPKCKRYHEDRILKGRISGLMHMRTFVCERRAGRVPCSCRRLMPVELPLERANERFLTRMFADYYAYQRRDAAKGIVHTPARVIRSDASKKLMQKVQEKKTATPRVPGKSDDSFYNDGPHLE